MNQIARPTAHARHSLVEQGFAVIDGELLTPAAPDSEWEAFARSWDDLGPDNYLPDDQDYRRRRFGILMCDIRTRKLTACAPRAFYQAPDVNCLVGGVHRTFLPLLSRTAESRCLESLIWADLGYFEALSRMDSAHGELEVQVHQIRILADNGKWTLPAPEGMHRDGHDFLAIHLVRRENVEGGTNIVYDASGEKICGIMLNRPFDTILLDDARLLHDIEPVRAGPGAAAGYRDVLLLDFNLASSQRGA